MSNLIWSYSSLKDFKQCPKKYYHLRVAKDVKQSDNVHTLYGKEVHKAAEDFVTLGLPIPDKFKFMRRPIESVAKIKGDKYCELKLGISNNGDFAACDFFAPDVWWRGVADLVSVNGNTAYSLDYKTNKNIKYADITQLDLVAAALFLKFPEVDVIKSGLLFVVCNEFLPKTHYRKDLETYLTQFEFDLLRISTAQETSVWNAKEGPLCGFCPVTSCVHNRRRE